MPEEPLHAPVFPEPDEFGLVDPDEMPPLPQPDLEAFAANVAATPRVDPAHFTHPYIYSDSWVQTHRNTGQRQMGIAALTGRSRAVQVHAPLVRKEVNFLVIRRGEQPYVPSPEPPNENWVAEEQDILVGAVRLVEDIETFEWIVSGRYLFFLLDPTWIEEGIQCPIHPWTTIPLSEAVIAVERFKAGLFS